MVVKLPHWEYEVMGERKNVLFMSDLHIGEAGCRKDLIVDDLNWARQNDAVVLMAGDIFGLILPKDHKRYNPSRIDPDIVHRDDQIRAHLRMGMDILSPYAKHLYMIGCGNHETKVLKYHSIDIIAQLVEELRVHHGSPVKHGAYSGAVILPFWRKEDHSNGGGFRVWYHHGRGADAPVTKGLIDFHRISTYVEGADVLWMGHKHHRYVVSTKVESVPIQGSSMLKRDVWHIMTGAYTESDKDEQLDEHGSYQSDFVIEKGYAPQGLGGVRMTLEMKRGHKDTRVKVRSSVTMEV